MTKLIMKICYKLLYVIQGVKSIFDKVTSQLISKFLVTLACLHAPSDRTLTFLRPISIYVGIQINDTSFGFLFTKGVMIHAMYVIRCGDNYSDELRTSFVWQRNSLNYFKQYILCYYR